MLGSGLVIAVFGAFALGVAVEGPIRALRTRNGTEIEMLLIRVGSLLLVGGLLLFVGFSGVVSAFGMLILGFPLILACPFFLFPLVCLPWGLPSLEGSVRKKAVVVRSLVAAVCLSPLFVLTGMAAIFGAPYAYARFSGSKIVRSGKPSVPVYEPRLRSVDRTRPRPYAGHEQAPSSRACGEGASPIAAPVNPRTQVHRQRQLG